jgi:hypothetical protein
MECPAFFDADDIADTPDTAAGGFGKALGADPFDDPLDCDAGIVSDVRDLLLLSFLKVAMVGGVCDIDDGTEALRRASSDRSSRRDDDDDDDDDDDEPPSL